MKKGVFISVLILFAGVLLTAYVKNSIHDDTKGSLHAESNSEVEDADIGDEPDDTYKVVIDPGHGGKDNGAEGEDGRYEKEFTLSLGKEVEDMLEAESDISVSMTRDDDTFISQESRDRPDYANEENADLYISLHGNTFDDPSVSGTETYYYSDDTRSLAETMQNHVTGATEFSDRGIKQKDLFVLRDTDMPAVLLEVGYITNPDNEEAMFTDDFQQEVATSIVDGINEYRDHSEEPDDDGESSE